MNTDFLKKGAVLAPMAGVTDMPFRVLCHEMGCPMAVSEMVSAKGFLMAKRDGRAAHQLLSTDPAEAGAVALQIFGSEPEIMARAAEELTRGGKFAFLDINMGCPVPKIVGNNEGSALLKKPELAAEIVRQVSSASHVPVTVKMRIGFEADGQECLTLAPMLEKAGASMITLHARTRSQFYDGQADWSMIRRVRERIAVPLIGNGDIRSAEDALRMLDTTGCDGVAVGRAAQGNPWLFESIARAFAGQPQREVTCEEKIVVVMRHARALAAFKSEKVAVCEMRRHVSCYIRGMRDAVKFRTKINQVMEIETLEVLLRELMAAQK